MLEYLFIFLGAGLGGVSRFIAGKQFTEYFLDKFPHIKFLALYPFSTMLINILGSILIGFISEILILKYTNSPPEIKLFLVTGFLGGFTTFSSFSLEAVTLLHNQYYAAFTSYILLTVCICIIGCIVGMEIAKLF